MCKKRLLFRLFAHESSNCRPSIPLCTCKYVDTPGAASRLTETERDDRQTRVERRER